MDFETQFMFLVVVILSFLYSAIVTMNTNRLQKRIEALEAKINPENKETEPICL